MSQHFIVFYLVHKRLKIGPEFLPTVSIPFRTVGRARSKRH